MHETVSSDSQNARPKPWGMGAGGAHSSAGPRTTLWPAEGRARAAKPRAQAARVVAQALAQASGSVLLEAWAGEEAADGAADSRDDVAARVAEVRVCGSKMRPPQRGGGGGGGGGPQQ